MKRFQECSRIEKAWRYRWYIALPFIWLFHHVFGTLKVYIDAGDGHIDRDDFYRCRGRELWQVLKGTVQHKMGWYYTWDEVKSRIMRDRTT